MENEEIKQTPASGGSPLNGGLDGYQTEARSCCDCKNFKDMGVMQIPICTKKLMGVTRTMRVTFKTSDGTCFEPMTPNAQ